MSNVKNLPECKYGEKCYRKNQQHLDEYYHPQKKSETESSKKDLKRQSNDTGETSSNKKARIEKFFKRDVQKDSEDTQNKKPESQSSEKESLDDEQLIKAAENFEKSIPGDNVEASTSSKAVDTNDCTGTGEAEIEEPSDIKENIKSKFLVDMPDDFYQLWEFCSNLNPKNPSGALESVLGFTLVGPYDILSGKHKRASGKKPNYLLHYRYYYDPPEFLTVIKGDSKTQFHLGYFRDDPKDLPVFVASNASAVDCVIKPRGGNIFSALCACIDERIKETPDSKTSLQTLRGKIVDWANLHKISLEVKTEVMKKRDKKVVTKSFHGAGVVVPVDENEVGYRPLPETPADLKKILKKIVDSKSQEERDKNFDPLMEIMTLVQFANDECDYGEGLELGLDLFSYGSDIFHQPILGLLPLAYQLLRREPFSKIIEAHLACRTRSDNVNQLK